MNRLLLLLSICLLGLNTISAQKDKTNLAKVKEACFNYINAFYEADTSLAYKSVHKDLRKVGFYFNEEKQAYSGPLEMPFDDLVSLAKRWNVEGNKTTPDSPKEVTVFEVADKTANAKVTAVWGIDYLSLVKVNNEWMIINVLWQSPPKQSVSGSN